MDLYAFLEPTLRGLGYELVDLEAPNHGQLIRLFIDKPEGITLDDCESVSNHVSRLLEVENIDYDRLEVSSPGLDRPLRKEADFQRFSGEKAQVRLRIPMQGQRNFTGVLRGMQDGHLQLEVEGALVSLDLKNIAKARLIPNI